MLKFTRLHHIFKAAADRLKGLDVGVYKIGNQLRLQTSIFDGETILNEYTLINIGYCCKQLIMQDWVSTIISPINNIHMLMLLYLHILNIEFFRRVHLDR